MMTMTDAPRAEVRIQRYQDAPDCDVVVTFRGKVMELRCPNYDQAVKWARVECKNYGLGSAFIDER
jgi:hypothetical protein